jgi:hypothetical protein
MILPEWNVLVPVVEVVRAATAEKAIEALRARLEAGGFDTTYASESGSSDAFFSETNG